MSSEKLSTTQVVVIVAGIAAIGGALAYYIHRRSEDDVHAPLAPHPHAPKTLAPSPHAQVSPPSHVHTHASQPVLPPSHLAPIGPSAQPHAAAPSPLALAASHFRGAQQQNVDDVTILRTAAINPSLSQSDREFASSVLRQAGIAPPRPLHRHSHAQAQPTTPTSDGDHDPSAYHHAPPSPQHPASHEPSWQPTPLSSPHMMPDAHAYDAHEAHAIAPPPLPTAHGPNYWTNVVHDLGLVKAGDHLLSTKEAQRYLNTIGGFPHLAEDGILGPNTKNTIEAFQLTHRLPSTGAIDPETSNAILYAAFVVSTPQAISPGF